MSTASQSSSRSNKSKSSDRASVKKAPASKFGEAKGKKPSFGTRNRKNAEMIYIGNLNYKIKEKDLVGIFGRYGKVGHVKLVIDLKTKRSKGIAFVEMFDRDDAVKAIAALNGKTIDGRVAKVSMAIAQKK